MLDETQYATVRSLMHGHMELDEYGKSTICSLYFDTPDFRLIRTSMQKPVYKEKLRLRTYGVPTSDSASFAEIKKKYKGIVYKRRVKLPYSEALEWLCGNRPAPKDSQIAREIDYFCKYYKGIAPTCALFYDREAYYSLDGDGVRITIDENIRYRFSDVDLRCGDGGEHLTGKGQYLMEIKIPGGMPLWLAHGLGEARIYPVSFSKYANAYRISVIEKKVKEVEYNG